MPIDLVDEQVDTLSVADEVVTGAGIAGDDNRVGRIVEAEAEGLVDRGVIDTEAREPPAVAVDGPAFFDLVDAGDQPLGPKALAAPTDIDVVGEGVHETA